MTLRRLLSTVMLACGIACLGVSSSHAFCSVLSYSATAASREAAVSKANASGLSEVRRLNKTYANRVKYEPAQVACTGGRLTRCTITQSYCVADNPVVRDTCPGDSVRNKQGKCVKEDEPVQANPCSGGRLYSLSRKVCHCPESNPVWTGQRCIGAKPVSGPTNTQIQQRCRQLDQECKSGLTGACRALPIYCDRG